MSRIGYYEAIRIWADTRQVGMAKPASVGQLSAWSTRELDLCGRPGVSIELPSSYLLSNQIVPNSPSIWHLLPLYGAASKMIYFEIGDLRLYQNDRFK